MPQRTPDRLEWVSLTDFTPGIYNRSMRVLGSAAGPAPLGAAQETNTYRCIGLASGGLAPLPKQTQTYPGPSLDTHANITDGPHVVGFIANGQVGAAGFGANRLDEFLFGVEYLYNDGTRRFKWINMTDLGATNTTFALRQITSAQPNPTSAFWGMTSGISRMLPAGSTFTDPGYPVVIGAWACAGGAYEKWVGVFPDPGAPGAMGQLNLYNYVAADGRPAVKIHCHQGRVIFFQDIFYAHGLGPAAVGVLQNVDEQIIFTDPPNSPNVGAQNTIFVQEYPTGYCAYGSITAGELFLLKRRGGGVIVSGDIANPNVTRLPGVVSGGRIQSKAASTIHGLFYATGDMGAYVWRGGNESQKISGQLEDNFFMHPSTTNYLAQQVFFEEWGDWVVCTNNWLYDSQTGGWWRLEDTAVNRFWGFSRSFDSRFMYGCLASYTTAGSTFAADWDRETPALSYSWQSQPIPATMNRLTEVRDMVLHAQGSGTVTLTLTGIAPNGADTTQSETFTVTHTAQPQRLRPTVGGTFIKGYNVVVRIQSAGETAAPIVYGVHLGTRSSQMATAT